MEEFDDYTTVRSRSLEEDKFVPGTDAVVVRYTLRVYGTAFALMLFAFCVFRKRYPRLYNVRRWATKLKCELAQKEYGFISWMWEVYSPSDDEILDQCGMDALCFLRTIQFGLKVSCVGIFNSLWLLPMYATAEESSETSNVEDPVQQLTTSHLPSQSRRFIGTVIGAYIIFLYTMYLMLGEFEWYTETRHKFLSKRTPRNYAIYVSGIPKEYQSSHLLLEYFQSCFSRRSLLEAHVAMDIPALFKQDVNRAALVAKLEHALAVKQIYGYSPTHLNLRDLSQKVNSIEAYENELRQMNKDIGNSVRRMHGQNDRLRGNLEASVNSRMLTIDTEDSVPLSPTSHRRRLDSDTLQLFPLTDSPHHIRQRRSNGDYTMNGTKQSIFRDRPSITEIAKEEWEHEIDEESVRDSDRDEWDDEIDRGSVQDSKESEVNSILPTPHRKRNTSSSGAKQQCFPPEEPIEEQSAHVSVNEPVDEDVDAAITQWNDAMMLATGTPVSFDCNKKNDAKQATIQQWNDDVSVTGTLVSSSTRSKVNNDHFEDDLESNTGTRVSFESEMKNDAGQAAINQWNGAERLLSFFNVASKTNNVIDVDLESTPVSFECETENDSKQAAINQWNDAMSLGTGGTPVSLNVSSKINRGIDVDLETAVDIETAVGVDDSQTMDETDADTPTNFEGAGTLPLTGSRQSASYGNLSIDSEASDTTITPLGRMMKGHNALKSAVLGSSDQLVKVVTGSSSKAVVRGVGDAMREVNVDNLKKVTDMGIRTLKTQGVKSIKQVTQQVTNVGTYAISEVVHTAKDIIVRSEDGVPRDAGFVIFTKLSTTHAALQMIHNSKPYVMDVEEAPDPDDIYWDNVGKSNRSRQFGQVLSFMLSAILCFFWTIPVSFISGLSEIESLKRSIPFLEKMVEKNPWMEQLLAQIAPLLLIGLNLLLPLILREFAKVEGHIASSALEASLFVKLSAFMIIQTFFVSAISGGVYAELTKMLEKPREMVDLLANSLPTRGTYFVQIVLVTTFLGQGLELLRVYPLAIAFARSKIGPNLTEKERNTPFREFLRPLSDPQEFEHAEVFANVVLYFMVIFVYAIISPIINYFMVLCFLVMGSGYRYQFIANYPSTNDSGGKLFSGFMTICLVCMVIAQITLVGLLALKKATYALPCMAPLLIITIGFTLYLRGRHFYVTNHLPTRDCLQLDRQYHTEGKVDFEFVKSKYLQPTLQVADVHPDVEDAVTGESRFAYVHAGLRMLKIPHM